MLPFAEFNDLSNKVCVRNKTEDLNLSMFYIIIRKIKGMIQKL